MGQILFGQQRFAEAREAQLHALNVMETNNLKDKYIELSIRLQLATIYPTEGNFVEAASSAEKGLTLCEAAPLCRNSYMHSCFLSLLANTYVRRQEWAKAEELLKRSRAICVNLSDKASQAELRKIDITLASIHQASGK
jgi:tetratricopeptide (TPR) repeat protein